MAGGTNKLADCGANKFKIRSDTIPDQFLGNLVKVGYEAIQLNCSSRAREQKKPVQYLSLAGLDQETEYHYESYSTLTFRPATLELAGQFHNNLQHNSSGSFL